MLAGWNRKVNLTALQLSDCSDQAIDRLLIEPIQAASTVDDSVLTWWDVGSGGGSPALPFKIVKPAVGLVMVESRSKKVAFLREAVRRLGLLNAQVLHGRFDELARAAAAQESVDLITVRAVRPDALLLTDCGRLLGTRGRLLLFQSVDAVVGVPAAFELVEDRRLLGGASELRVLRKR